MSPARPLTQSPSYTGSGCLESCSRTLPPTRTLPVRANTKLNSFPRYRPCRLRAQILQKNNQYGQAKAPEEEQPGSIAEDGSKEGAFLLFAAPIVGNLDVRTIVSYFVAQDLYINARMGVFFLAG